MLGGSTGFAKKSRKLYLALFFAQLDVFCLLQWFQSAEAWDSILLNTMV